jgi:hypothetical protein
LTKDELLGKIVRINQKGLTRAQIYLITDQPYFSGGKVPVTLVLRWLESNDMDLTFYEEMK